MKILFCDHCGSVVPMEYTLRLCSCGRIGGRYTWEDDDSLIIYLSEMINIVYSRAIAIANEFLRGESDDHRTWVIPRHHPKLWYYIEDSNVIMHEGEEIN